MQEKEVAVSGDAVSLPLDLKFLRDEAERALDAAWIIERHEMDHQVRVLEGSVNKVSITIRCKTYYIVEVLEFESVLLLYKLKCRSIVNLHAMVVVIPYTEQRIASLNAFYQESPRRLLVIARCLH